MTVPRTTCYVGPIPREKVVELAKTHAELDDRATAAVWIRKDETTVWLIEVVPTFPEIGPEEDREEPIFFNPGVYFRFPLALIAGTRRTLEKTIESDRELARHVASGDIVFDDGHGEANELVEYARKLSTAA